MMIAGMAAGALWGFIPGVLKARFKVNEIISTLMLNYVAELLMEYVARGPLQEPGGSFEHGREVHGREHRLDCLLQDPEVRVVGIVSAGAIGSALGARPVPLRRRRPFGLRMAVRGRRQGEVHRILRIHESAVRRIRWRNICFCYTAIPVTGSP